MRSRLIWAGAGVFLLASCGSSDLSRQQAQEILQATVREYQGQIEFPLKGAVDKCLESAGVLHGWNPFGAQVTPLGKSLVLKSSYSLNSDPALGLLWLKQPFQIVIADVDGIAKTPDGAGRMVEYRVRFDGPSQVEKRVQACFVLPEKTYRATFRLFDDGWRIEDTGMEQNKKD